MALWGAAAGLGLGLVLMAVALSVESARLLAWPGLALVAAAGLSGGAIALRELSARGPNKLLLGAALATDRNASFITEPSGRVIYANRALEALVPGLARGESPLDRLWPAESGEGSEADRLRAATRRGEAVEAELALSPGGENAEWMSLSAAPLAGAPGHLLWRLADITERRAYERALRDERAWYAGLLDTLPVGFYASDFEGRFLFVNAALGSALGARPGELVESRRGFGDFRLDEQAPAAELTDGEDEVRLHGPGEATWRARVTRRVLRDGEGTLKGSVALVENIGGALALGGLGQRFLELFGDAPIGVALLNREGKVMKTNPAFGRMTPAAPESASLEAFLEGGEADEVRRSVDRLIAGESVAMPIEVRVPGSEGEKMLSLYITRLEEHTGEPEGLLVHMIDNTDQKKLEIQFAQAQKMQAVGQLAGGIAHDFNNLLTAILGFCDLLLIRHQAGDQSFSDIMQVKQNAMRATNLVRQLLAFSRQQTLKPKVTDITDVLAELSHLLRRLIGENIEFNLIHERDLWLIKVDQGPLEQVVINLAVNARDAMQEGGTLTVQTRNVVGDDWDGPGQDLLRGREFVLVEVSDTGVGIPTADVDKIFEPFFTTKDVGKGTGLGLSTVYGIVKQFKGYVFVKSAPAAGTSFYVFLPRHEPDAKEEAALTRVVEESPRAAPPRDLTGKETVLLVEDEEAVRIFSARALRNKGYTVLEADSGDSALELIDSYGEPIDIVVTDVVMPRMDGRTLVQKLRARDDDVKVIFISGYAEEAFRSDLAAEGTINFLPKPFSIRQLASKVKEVLSGDAA